MSTAIRWADELAREISSGKYAADKEGWLENFDPRSLNVTAMAWSNEANHYVCTHGENSPFGISFKDVF